MPVDVDIPWPAHRRPAVNAGGGIDTLYESLAGGGSSGASRRVLFDYTRQLFAKRAK
jgi:hypothetical protein